MTDFAFRPSSKAEANRIKGKLEVRTKVDSPMGLSDEKVPAGTTGYVLGTRHDSGKRQVLVYWPTLPKAHKGDWRTSSHDWDHMEPTGKRG